MILCIVYLIELMLHVDQIWLLLKQLKRSYLTDRIYKPLSDGNIRPFFRYIKDMKGNNNQIMSITTNNGKLTQNKTEIANSLNSFFHSVFSAVSSLPPLPSIADADTIDITKEGVIKLLKSLKVQTTLQRIIFPSIKT